LDPTTCNQTANNQPQNSQQNVKRKTSPMIAIGEKEKTNLPVLFLLQKPHWL
jgi:hypothetical protein